MAPVRKTAGAVLCLLAGLPSMAMARDITILDDKGPVAGARVSIRGKSGIYPTDAAGVVRLPELPPGTHVLDIVMRDGGRIERTIAAGPDALTIVPGDPAPSAPLTLPPLQVSATPLARGVDDVATPATVLAGPALDGRLQGTLGETLKDVPGVASTQFGPGASRPIIRGFDGPRVRVLSDGVDTLDAATVSPDHAVTSEPLLAKQIEILKGPATLLYGGGAIGGVVNVIDNRVPTAVPDKNYEGVGEMRRNFDSGEMAGALGFTVGTGNIAARFEGALRQSDDYHTAKRFGDPPSRRVRNSFSDSSTLTGGLSWVGNWGYLGAAFTDQKNEYGIPSEEDVSIKLDSRRLDVRSEVRAPWSGIERLRLRLGYVDYQHKEIEGQEIATIFKNEALDGRLEVVHNPFDQLRGVIGVQGLYRDFKAKGEEAFLPPSVTRNFGVFLLERYGRDEFHIEGGLRYEWQRINVRSGQPDRKHDGFSASLGVVWDFMPGFAVGLSFSRSQRLPTAEELYASGPHVATGQFEIGDPDLKTETSHNLELTLRKKTGDFQFGVSVYRNFVKDFIFQADTGAVIDDLRVVNFRQQDAVLYGFEAEAKYAVTRFLDLSVFGDYVRARLRRGDDLPRIPPGRLGGRIDASWESWTAYFQFYHVFRQNDVAPFETKTGGHNMLNAGIAYGGEMGPLTSYQVFLRANNLLNEKAIVHTSFIKASVPLPGFNITLGARFTF